MDIEFQKNKLFDEIKKLNDKYELSKNIPENYFEPGMMENLDQYYGSFDTNSNTALIRTEVKGLRYEGRTVELNKINIGDTVCVIRESDNPYNSNNFMVHSSEGKSLGNIPADLCNAIAPLYDLGYLVIEKSTVSYIERIFERSRYAKQGILFIELSIHFRNV